MSDSYLEVTSGSGFKLHTNLRTIFGNSVHDQGMFLGENYNASYTAQTTNVSTATANSHLFQVMAGASLLVRIRRIEIHQQTAATTATLMLTQILRLTTAGTGGGTVTPNPLDTTDAASGATCMTLPTVKGTEGTGIVNAVPYMMQTVAASAQLSNPIIVWDFDRLRTKPLLIAAGATNGICFKNPTAVAAGQITFVVYLDETSFA